MRHPPIPISIPYQGENMDIKILVTLIAFFSSILVAIATYYLNKLRESESKWREYKMEYYRQFLLCLSKITGNPSNDDQNNFSNIVNTITLFAPQYVIQEVNKFLYLVTHEKVNLDGQQYSEKHNQLINSIMLAIRKDIGIRPTDNKNTFNFALMRTNNE